ncbi:MAG: hypothetical protein LBR82_10675 [Desulfovibrio sp.]|jgi:hypothetical protein|nr:hypothetical protein [Desulfovibrio sp.]
MFAQQPVSYSPGRGRYTDIIGKIGYLPAFGGKFPFGGTSRGGVTSRIAPKHFVGTFDGISSMPNFQIRVFIG